MGKRKRVSEEDAITASVLDDRTTSQSVETNGHAAAENTTASVIQIVAGSYERVLHGITATISNLPSQNSASVQFEDTFLFNAHASAIRCIALSPPPQSFKGESHHVYLATGGSDEKINVYQLSTSPMTKRNRNSMVLTLGNNKVSENPSNRELGSILQHSSNITSLNFPTQSKLLSASEDNTIAISRVRDLAVISTVKAPHPKVQGQPSGDTSPLGITPAGINDFAVHPSMKLMISVGKGEKCMRLLNLVNGKRTGVLNFGKDVLMSVKESKYSTGEGRKIRWNKAGTEFAIAFERGAIIFGEDSKPRCKILPQPLTKLHQLRYIDALDSPEGVQQLLTVSTEDGRVIFYDTNNTSKIVNGEKPGELSIPDVTAQAQLGGKTAGIQGRVKDFQVLSIPADSSKSRDLVIVTANSSGTVKLWLLPRQALDKFSVDDAAYQVDVLLGTYETASRITCLDAFVMLPVSEDEIGLSEFESGTDEQEDVTTDTDEGDD